MDGWWSQGRQENFSYFLHLNLLCKLQNWYLLSLMLLFFFFFGNLHDTIHCHFSCFSQDVHSWLGFWALAAWLLSLKDDDLACLALLWHPLALLMQKFLVWDGRCQDYFCFCCWLVLENFSLVASSMIVAEWESIFGGTMIKGSDLRHGLLASHNFHKV